MITREVLDQLYTYDDLTDSQIASRYGTSQVTVSRWRQKWGIETRLKSDRLRLPPLTPRQRSVLIGSMLGDGHLSCTGQQTARFSEHHCVAQRAYLDWKSAEWGAHVASLIPTNKGEHRGFRFTTHANRELHAFWKQFYPSGRDEKTFIHLDPSQVDSLALAIWFQDDGSFDGVTVRFSASADPLETEVRLRILARFGLFPRVVRSKSEWALALSRQRDRAAFADQIRSHMHPTLHYKLPH